MSKLNPFKYSNDILQDKKHIMRNPEDENCDPEDAEKNYVPFLINKTISQHYDCVLYVNEMNVHNKLPKRMQFDYLFYSIPKKKRNFTKWGKSSFPSEELEKICEFFQCNENVAFEYLKLMTEEQIKSINGDDYR